MADYTRRERGLLRAADMIFYPTVRFVDIFATLGKQTFPSVNCYRFLGNKAKQTALLRLLNLPHPRTRIYYGDKQKRSIPGHFDFPFVAKRPFRSSGGRHVFLIKDHADLDRFTRRFNPAYIQEYVPGGRELRVNVLNYRVVLGYWRVAADGDFRCNLAQQGRLEEGDVPEEAVSLAHHVACAAELSDVAVDMVYDGSRFLVLELNFRYGFRGWHHLGKNRIDLITEMIDRGEL
jgi:ribosomal protein S6--L-glutamate ligase